MLRIISLSLIVFSVVGLSAQQVSPEIRDMKWGADFNIHITFSNDSTSIHEVKALHHSNQQNGSANDVTYYPVSLDQEFVKTLQNRELESFLETDSLGNIDPNAKSKTLWGALHNELGGGWIHFINSLVYAFESGSLSLTAPLMKRPESNWKPSPMTESFKRTKKWEYYVPVDQKLAHKEYRLKEKNKELGDIASLPPSFIQLFLNTNQKEYQNLKDTRQGNKVAIIDMVRLLVGANYLGREQIDYVENAVVKSVMKYNVNNLPSVIIFDDFGAAVAMTLDTEGYKINKIVFNNEDALSSEEISQRVDRMEGVIREINMVNKKVFEKNLKSYYN